MFWLLEKIFNDWYDATDVFDFVSLAGIDDFIN